MTPSPQADTLILASQSASRAHLLQGAHIPFEAHTPLCDEEELKKNFKGPLETLCEHLAQEKSTSLSATYKDRYILGADQVLLCNGKLYNKATNKKEAEETLLALRGRSHTLWTGAVLSYNHSIVWRYTTSSHLKVRSFSDTFLTAYLQAYGDALYKCVGCYQLEGSGIQLFENIDGDYFSILGLPLLPLCNALRSLHYLPT